MKQLVLLLLLINPSLGLAVTPSEIVPSGGGLIVYKEEAYYNNKLAGAMLFSKMIPRSPTTTQYFGAGGFGVHGVRGLDHHARDRTLSLAIIMCGLVATCCGDVSGAVRSGR